MKNFLCIILGFCSIALISCSNNENSGISSNSSEVEPHLISSVVKSNSSQSVDMNSSEPVKEEASAEFSNNNASQSM